MGQCLTKGPISHQPPLGSGDGVAVGDAKPDADAVASTTLQPHAEDHLQKDVDRITDRELEQMCGSTASLDLASSTFSSACGYPYQAYELGPPMTDDEYSRVQALRALDVLDTVSQGRRARLDEEADIVLEAIMRMFDAKTVLLALFDDSRIIVRNAKGIMSVGEFPHRWSFCAYTLTKQRPETLLIPDATKDWRFADNPNVLGYPGVRFYCGAPLVSASGHILGTLCFVDTAPRYDFDAGQCRLLNNLAELTVRQMERYRPNAGPAGQNDAETTALARVARTLECYATVTGMVDISLSDGWMIMYVNEMWESLVAPCKRQQLLGRKLQTVLQPEPEPEPAAAADGAADGRRPDGEEEQASQEEALEFVSPEQAAERLQRQRRSLLDAALSPAELWAAAVAALRGGEVVEMRVRLRGEDGQPAGRVMLMTARNANSHVLDAAVQMPVGVPPQAALPPSILAAAPATVAAPGQGPSPLASATPSGCGQPPPPPPNAAPQGQGLGAMGTTDTAVVEPLTTADFDSSIALARPAAEPHYCFITLTPLAGEEGGGDGGGEAGDGSGGEGEASDCGARPAQGAGSRTSATVSSSGGWARSGGAGSGGVIGSGAGGVGGGRSGGRSNGGVAFEGVASLTGAYGRRVLPAAIGSGRGGIAAAPAHATTSTASNANTNTGGGASRPPMPCIDPRVGAGWTYGMEPLPGLKLGQLLGKGGYGKVFEASYRGRQVAAKVVANAMLKTANCLNGVTLEALLAQELEHPYIVRTYKCVVRFFEPAAFDPRGSQLGPQSSRLSQQQSQNQTQNQSQSLNNQSQSLNQQSFFVIPQTPSGRSALPDGLSVAGPADGAAASSAVAVGAASPAPAGARSAAAVSSPPPTPLTGGASSEHGASAVTAAAVSAAAAARPVAVAAPSAPPAPGPAAATDFDSFDCVGEEGGDREGGGGGMIDQLGAGLSGVPAFNSNSMYPPSAAGTATLQSIGPGSLRPWFDTRSPQLAPAGSHRPSMDATGGFRHSNAVASLRGSVDAGASAAISVFGAAAAAAAAAGGTGSAASQLGGRGRGEALPDGETWILQEYCSRGTLQDAIDTGRLRTEPSRLRGGPHLPHIFMAAQEVASAMACLHSRGYMHGDLSAVNVLLTDAEGDDGGCGRGWVAKVSDFGLAKALPDPTKPYVSSVYGVITHCAPEVLKYHTQTQKADSYSFGVLLWQMFTGSRPWANMNRFQILGAVTTASSPGLRFLPTQQPPPRYRDLTMRCLSYDPAARPSFAEICEELRLMSVAEATAAVKRGLGLPADGGAPPAGAEAAEAPAAAAAQGAGGASAAVV
ncbi:hypothetical protein GPECTOR_58g578 [Gonium pectorale]|uniref:Protein kinase domain-containing protein n=1 Tax=Gonium pectorale TaxID=33097 RepID=A0A150G5H0_GONPE|nr:hypothetical protein GPECTOR_58g578 [Gonium pectorale]|eukprot:KXZ45129.1 hypothetical protein GPECTOR_58g578 [Gonium pectorale]